MCINIETSDKNKYEYEETDVFSIFFLKLLKNSKYPKILGNFSHQIFLDPNLHNQEIYKNKYQLFLKDFYKKTLNKPKTKNHIFNEIQSIFEHRHYYYSNANRLKFNILKYFVNHTFLSSLGTLSSKKLLDSLIEIVNFKFVRLMKS